MPADDNRLAELSRLLRSEPRTARELTAILSISQPTLSRTIQEAPDRFSLFRVTGERTPRYGLLRPLPAGILARQNVYRIDAEGGLHNFAEVEFLSGGSTLERCPTKNTLYEGLAPYMAFSSPSGFLGRQVAQDVAADLHLPQSLRDWNDDHRIAYLFSRGVNLPGNLVFGDTSLQRERAFRKALVVPASAKLAHYVAMAGHLKGTPSGSSAGGEQPKFLSLVEDVGHVIVKFAKRGSRMANLLPLEHLALRSLEAGGVRAAQSALMASDDFVFLEIRRFDRVGRHGRIGMLSAGAIDDEYFGNRDTWSDFAARCLQAKMLTPDAARSINIMAAFSELIGNGDRHFENISLLMGDDGRRLDVAPAYDILPMRYASVGGGIDPELTPITPQVGRIGTDIDVWRTAANVAITYWQRVQGEDLGLPVAEAFRALAAQNLAVVKTFAAPWL